MFLALSMSPAPSTMKNITIQVNSGMKAANFVSFKTQVPTAIQDSCGAASPIRKSRDQGSKILLEVKERIPDKDWRTEKKKVLKGGNFQIHKQIFMLIQRIGKEASSCVVSTFCSVCTESCNLGPYPCLGESATHSGQVFLFFFFFFFFDIWILFFLSRCVRSMASIHKVRTFECGWLLLSST